MDNKCQKRGFSSRAVLPACLLTSRGKGGLNTRLVLSVPLFAI
jgi:hypothetical protein